MRHENGSVKTVLKYLTHKSLFFAVSAKANFRSEPVPMFSCIGARLLRIFYIETYGFAVLNVPNFLGTPSCLGKLQAMILFDLINGANDIKIESINV